jgi:two-component system, LytTR family, response regulator
MYKNISCNQAIFLLKTSRGTEVIDLSMLVRIEAISNYSKLFFCNGRTLVVAKVLAYFEHKLIGYGFARPHRSHIVNIQYITSCTYCGAGLVTLDNNEQIAVSKRKKIKFKQTIQHYFLCSGLRA